MKICVCCFFLLIFCVSFKANGSANESRKKTMRVINKYSDEIKKKFLIERTSYGLDYAGPDKMYDGKIHVVALGYSIDKSVNFEEGRKLFYQLVDGLIETINKEESIKDFFFHHPITYEDLEITLGFNYGSKRDLKSGDLDMICIYDNEIFYQVVEKDGKANELTYDPMGSGLYRVGGMLSNLRCIRKCLPEKDDAPVSDSQFIKKRY